MQVGTLKILIHMHGLESIKDKRRIVKSLTARIRSRFNASVAETGRHDVRQAAEISIAVVSNEAKHVHEMLDKILDFANRDGRFYTGSLEREVFGA